MKYFIIHLKNKLLNKVLQPNDRLLTHVSVAFILALFFYISGGSALYTSDSGAYLLNARELKVPGDRSIFYSCFIHYFSEYINFFHQPHIVEIVLIQSLIAYSIIFVFFKNFFQNKNQWMLLITILLFFCLTPLPWLLIQLMPDFFTCLVFFSAMLFLKSKDALSSFLLSLLLVVCLIMHNSTVLLFFLFSGGIWVFRKKLDLFNFKQSRFIQMFLASIVATLCVIGTSIYAKNGFTMASASHIFLMGKLSENGVLKKYLDKYCESSPNALCAYKDKLPEHGWDFVWEPNGAFMNSGGWEHSDTLYKQIIATTLKDPELLMANIHAAVKGTFQQILLTGAGDGIGKMDTAGTLVSELRNFYPYDYQRLMETSKQQKEEINFSAFNQWYAIFQWTFIFASILIIIKFKNKYHIGLFLMALYFSFCNAFITGALANIINRLNTKGIIVLVCVSMMIVIDQVYNQYVQYRLKNGSSSV